MEIDEFFFRFLIRTFWHVFLSVLVICEKKRTKIYLLAKVWRNKFSTHVATKNKAPLYYHLYHIHSLLLLFPPSNALFFSRISCILKFFESKIDALFPRHKQKFFFSIGIRRRVRGQYCEKETVLTMLRLHLSLTHLIMSPPFTSSFFLLLQNELQSSPSWREKENTLLHWKLSFSSLIHSRNAKKLRRGKIELMEMIKKFCLQGGGGGKISNHHNAYKGTRNGATYSL